MPEQLLKLLPEQDELFYAEMMAHPALFSHPQPQKIALVGFQSETLDEILKHHAVTEVTCIAEASQSTQLDLRVKYYSANALEWLQHTSEKFDVIICHHTEVLLEHYSIYYQALSAEGILIHTCPSPFTHFYLLKPIYQHIKQIGFHDWQTLNFSSANELHSALMMTKRQFFKRIHEKDIFNRSFTTRYYNYDMHKAALALPEFIQQELALINI